MKPSLKNKIGDFYLNNSLVLDLLIISIALLIDNSFYFFDILIQEKKENISMLSDLISASISLAGFILASLTIIASIRANIVNRHPDASRNPLEMFFSNENYIRIIQVFKQAIIELVIVFSASYFIWSYIENISNVILFKWIICSIFIIILSTFRTLMILFLIIKIDK